MGRPKGEAVDGVLLLDKAARMTSSAAVARARWLLAARKAGHTGTLDPLAEGLLPLTFGEASKFAADLLDADKAYEARVDFGVTTTTGDLEGEVTARRPVSFGRAQLEAVLARFTGEIVQVPPMHSALKRQGRPLYALARAGEVIERRPRPVRINSLRLLALDGAEAVLSVDCSKGTYVRVLAEDLGQAMGCGACLSGLRRTRVGPLSIEAAVTLAELEALEVPARRARLLPLDALLGGLPRVELGEQEAGRFCHGQRLPLAIAPAPRVRVYGRDARLLGVASVDEHGVLAPRRLIQAAAG
ncbi:MAG: tRNA pseudouridine(55) synthase TruB [Burkholderiales bacterium]|nr:MAG: tRNA pseudouridine(55) synthase TruB [Burkholderiales bacterium]